MAQNIFLGSIVPDPLRGHNNYREWSHCMKTYLVSQGLWDNIITEEISTDSPHNLQASDHDAESTDSQQASDHDSESPVVNQQASDHDEDRRRKNATALHAILITCEPDILRQLNVTDSAQIAWNLLAESYGEYGQLESPQIDDDTVACQEINEAEVRAIFHATHLSSSMTATLDTFLVFESDSMNAIGWINNQLQRRWRLAFILRAIDALKHKFTAAQFVHVLREKNSYADNLARMAMTTTLELVDSSCMIFCVGGCFVVVHGLWPGYQVAACPASGSF